jgi:hypothetical protein
MRQTDLQIGNSGLRDQMTPCLLRFIGIALALSMALSFAAGRSRATLVPNSLQQPDTVAQAAAAPNSQPAEEKVRLTRCPLTSTEKPTISERSRSGASLVDFFTR